MGRVGETGKPSLWLRLLISELRNSGAQAGFPVAGKLQILFPYCQGNHKDR